MNVNNSRLLARTMEWCERLTRRLDPGLGHGTPAGQRPKINRALSKHPETYFADCLKHLTLVDR